MPNLFPIYTGEVDKDPNLANPAKTRTANGWRVKLDKENHGANSEADKSIIYDEKILVMEYRHQTMPTVKSCSMCKCSATSFY